MDKRRVTAGKTAWVVECETVFGVTVNVPFRVRRVKCHTVGPDWVLTQVNDGPMVHRDLVDVFARKADAKFVCASKNLVHLDALIYECDRERQRLVKLRRAYSYAQFEARLYV